MLDNAEEEFAIHDNNQEYKLSFMRVKRAVPNPLDNIE
jgi:hypothetical protein